MIVGLIVLGAMAAVALAGRRAVRSLQARVAALEARSDASQRWQDEVRKALAAGKR